MGSGTSAAALLAACGTVQMAVGPSRVFNACNATRGTRRRSEGRALGPSPLFPVLYVFTFLLGLSTYASTLIKEQ